jgi:hypothetical protein
LAKRTSYPDFSKPRSKNPAPEKKEKIPIFNLFFSERETFIIAPSEP